MPGRANAPANGGYGGRQNSGAIRPQLSARRLQYSGVDPKPE